MDSNQNKSFSVVYMVAGMSSRFGGRVKQFARVGKHDETLIEISLNQALKAGFNKIIFIVGEKTEDLFKEKFGNSYNGVPIFYAKQTFNPSERDKPWGTCDAVVSAKELINEDFVVCNGDDLYGANTFKMMFNWINDRKTPATAGYKLGEVLSDKGTVNRGIFFADENNYLISINETLGIDRNNLASFGLTSENISSQNIWALRKTDVALLEEQLEKFKKLHNSERKLECYLPTELSNLIKEKKIQIKLLVAPDKWMGITNPEDEPILRAILSKIKY